MTQANDGVLFKATDGSMASTTTSQAFDTRSNRIMSVQATWDVNAPTTATFPPGTLEVQTLTFPAEAAAVDGDYLVVEDVAGTKWALALSKSGAAVKLLTFLAKASCVAGDWLKFYDAAGQAWAIAVNKSGTDAAPTAKGWLDIPSARKCQFDISGDTTNAQVAARAELAMNAMTGFSAAFTSDDSAADGTMLLACDVVGPVAEPESYKAASGSGLTTGFGTSVVGVESTAGYSTAEPAGDIWAGVAADHKDSIDVTGLNTADVVAAAAEVAFNALTGFTAAITSDDTAADGTMTFTQVEPGEVTDPVSKVFDDSGAGSATGVQSVEGVGGVNLGSDSFYHAAHGMATGLLGRMTTATTLPTGLATSTDYYVIKVDANNFKLATTLAHAQAGTAINITTRGTGTHTFTPTALSASIKLQGSNDGANWTDLLDGEMVTGANSQTISADGSHIWLIPNAYWKQYREYLTISAGQMTVDSAAYSK